MQFPHLFFSLVVLIILPLCLGEKILFFFGGGSYSMKNSVWPWATELADRGHDVTFLSSHTKMPTKHKKIRDLTSSTLVRVMDMSYGVDRFQERKNSQEKQLLSTYAQMTVDFCETIFLKSQQDLLLQKVIHNETYDLVVVNVIFGECGFVFGAKYNAKTIVFDGTVPLNSFFDVYGFPAETSWIPDLLMKYDNFPLNFFDRVTNTIWPLYWYWERHRVLYPGMERLMQKVLDWEKIPSFYELERSASLIVVNSHPATDFAYSLPPFIIQIGGLQTFLPEEEIPEKYQKFMDGGRDGVVLISFGSTVPLEKLPENYMHMFFKLIQKHKDIRFLMRWKGPLPKEYETGLDNLLASDWLPQRELLRHPNMKAFITHGGLNSIQEATFYGIPLIVLPLFAEQDYNAFRVEAQKIGFRLEVRDLSLKTMDDALHNILTDTQYKINMEVKSGMFRDRPQKPLETVVYWTEFVLRHDDVSSLKPMNGNLAWYQRRLLDVYLVYEMAVILLGFILFKSVALVVYGRSRNYVATTKKKLS